jgi:hypothetical protein
MAMTIPALVLHVTWVVLCGIAVGRMPWGNRLKFLITGTALITLIFLLLQFWQNLKFLGVFVTGLTKILLGIATANYRVCDPRLARRAVVLAGPDRLRRGDVQLLGRQRLLQGPAQLLGSVSLVGR